MLVAIFTWFRPSFEVSMPSRIVDVNGRWFEALRTTTQQPNLAPWMISWAYTRLIQAVLVLGVLGDVGIIGGISWDIR